MRTREKETAETISSMRDAMIGPVEKPVLYLIPILTEIALSLAVIADKCTEEDAERGQDEQIR